MIDDSGYSRGYEPRGAPSHPLSRAPCTRSGFVLTNEGSTRGATLPGPRYLPASGFLHMGPIFKVPALLESEADHERISADHNQKNNSNVHGRLR